MINQLKKLYRDIGKIKIVPVKIQKPVWLKVGLFIIFIVSFTACWNVTYNIREYVYENQLTQYYVIVGSLPSFLSVIVIYYLSLCVLLAKNKWINAPDFATLLGVIILTNIFYELTLTNTFDSNDIIAIFLGGIAVSIIEITGCLLKKAVRKISQKNK